MLSLTLNDLKKKIVNIHTDKNFLNLYSGIFPSDKFDNHTIFLGYESIDEFKPAKNLYHFNHDRDGIKKVLEICKNAHIVILHKIDLIKLIIANRVKEDVLIIWRFFGQELYSKIPDAVYSNTSKRFIGKEYSYRFLRKSFREFLGSAKSIIKYRVKPKNEVIKALKRLDYFAGLSKAEYLFLQTHFPDLPEFIQVPYHQPDIEPINISEKKLDLIIGNNRSIYNNHLDLLHLISQTKINPTIKFILLFSYGNQSKYSKRVLEKARDIPNLKIVNDFLSQEKFNNLYRNSAALVINGYRQMAMGNIMTALRSKTKVYLNEKNPIYDWLLDEGFHIYSIEQLETDLVTGDIRLTETTGMKNQLNCDQLCERYSVVKFQEKLLSLGR